MIFINVIILAMIISNISPCYQTLAIVISDIIILHTNFISSQPMRGVILELIISIEIMSYLWSGTPLRQRQVIMDCQMVSRGRVLSHYRKVEEKKQASSNFSCLTFL